MRYLPARKKQLENTFKSLFMKIFQPKQDFLFLVRMESLGLDKASCCEQLENWTKHVGKNSFQSLDKR